ncbi:hypothetical protein [Nakamurella antarctica]|uniref:hypothetical protein n=1 Tax=Nakamurella antarctica TaxID=1902245 RepID=UPI0013DDD761|nr:hypothetical protein [Nakamurella antarctica]
MTDPNNPLSSGPGQNPDHFNQVPGTFKILNISRRRGLPVAPCSSGWVFLGNPLRM